MIDAKTKVFGLLANPIGHSLSPRFQNALAAYCGENAVYLPFEVKRPETLEAALKGAHALGIAGLNVTVPYKEAVIPYLSGLSEEARLIGAVNTLVRSEEGYVGHNTDIAGMERMLLRQGLSIRGAKVLVLGAGGAARSAAVLAALKGAAELVILNRNRERAEALAESVRQIAPTMTVRSLSRCGTWRRNCLSLRKGSTPGRAFPAMTISQSSARVSVCGPRQRTL